MDFVALRQQRVAHVTAWFQDGASPAIQVYLEGAGVHVEPQRQLRVLQEFLRQEIRLGVRLGLGGGPPERTRLTQDITERLGVAKTCIHRGDPTEARTRYDDFS